MILSGRVRNVMGTAVELIAELESEAKKFDFVYLIVDLQADTRYVSNFNQNRLEVLNDMLERGGIPLGFIGFTNNPSGGTWGRQIQPLAAYQGIDRERVYESLRYLAKYIMEYEPQFKEKPQPSEPPERAMPPQEKGLTHAQAAAQLARELLKTAFILGLIVLAVVWLGSEYEPWKKWRQLPPCAALDLSDREIKRLRAIAEWQHTQMPCRVDLSDPGAKSI